MNVQLTLTLNKRLLLLLCTVVVGFFITGVLAALLMAAFSPTTFVVRMVTMLQDILVFIVPPVATALIVTRRPATLLCLDSRPRLLSALLWMLLIVVSIPAMNVVVAGNASMPLPEGLRDMLLAAENHAAETIAVLCGPHTVGNLIVSVLIVGVMAGVGEELLFRGCLQRMLTTGGVNPHTAIWVTAAVFSLVHFQMLGFVPRMLLGAMFGYALYYTGSIWVPMLMHALNNTIYVVSQWVSDGGGSSYLDNLGVSGNKSVDVALVLVSLTLTCLIFTYAGRLRSRRG